jgi:hypothetical protein
MPTNTTDEAHACAPAESRGPFNTEPNSLVEIQARAARGEITWTKPLLLLGGRTALIVAAQSVVALIFRLRGSPLPWRAAGPWWTVYGTLVDVGCLALLWKFTHAEGIRIRDLIGPIRLRYGRDIFIAIGILAMVFPLFVAGGFLTSLWFYGQLYAPEPYPGVLSGRVLPLWATIYSCSLWWLIWSPTEELTYAGYLLPRLKVLSRRTWVAVVLVGFWWTIQHCFLPFIGDWRLFVWRFLAFLPGVIVLVLVYFRIRRLAPLILAHWVMDISATVMTLRF